MNGSMRLLVLFGLLIIVGVSCQSMNTAIASVTPEPSPNWWTTWLAQPVCKPPCWQNITPGLTARDEALSILENTPELTITFQTEDAVEWGFNQNRGEGGWLGISQDGIVAWLVNASDSNLYLKLIVASYNYPKYVKPYDCREGMCSTVLIYPDLGMLLSVFIKNSGESNDAPQIEILPEAVVNRVYFIEPGMENFQNQIEFQDYDLLMDWKGYGEYP